VVFTAETNSAPHFLAGMTIPVTINSIRGQPGRGHSASTFSTRFWPFSATLRGKTAVFFGLAMVAAQQ